LPNWLRDARPSLQPAIENPRNTKAFIDSLNQRNRTDGLAARGLAFYGVERHPTPYEPLSPARRELRALSRYRTALIGQRTALKNRRQEGRDSCIVAQMQARLTVASTVEMN
jgi:transposase